MHYYQHHIGDFVRDTSSLKDGQVVAYLRLLWIYYESEQPLPDDFDVLAMRVGSDIDTVSLLLRAFFRKDGDVWVQSRCEREIKEYHSICERNRVNGKSGGRPKNKPSGFPVGSQWDATGNPKETHAEPKGNPDVTLTSNQYPVTSNHKPIKKTSAVAPPDGVTDSVWADFVQLRRDKKAKLTQTALDGIYSECLKAGWTMDSALRECCSRGWVGFKADWVSDKSSKPLETAYQKSMRLRVAEAAPALAQPDPSNRVTAIDFFNSQAIEVIAKEIAT